MGRSRKTTTALADGSGISAKISKPIVALTGDGTEATIWSNYVKLQEAAVAFGDGGGSRPAQNR
jgi:hypothetical protein